MGSVRHRMTVARGVADAVVRDHKDAARRAVHSALRAGAIERPETCEECNGVLPLHEHHQDYSRPLEVRWLCQPCHAEAHWGRRSPGVGGVPCPSCASSESRVLDSRARQGRVYRRRRCGGCGTKFSTYETAVGDKTPGDATDALAARIAHLLRELGMASED